MEALNCPSCGSSDIVKVSATEYKCQNCQTNSRLSENKSFLVLNKANTCPNCDEINSENAKFCISCGFSLFKLCSNCKTSIPVNAHFCMNCGKQLEKICSNCKSYTSVSSNTCKNCGFDPTLKKKEGDSYKVYLCEVKEPYKDKVIKLLIREFDMNQKKARETLNETTRIASNVSIEEAKRLKYIFEEYGAKIEIF